MQYDKVRTIMREAIRCCEENKCELSSSITTNGYLLNESILKEMKELHISQMQITVDSNRKIHDSRRILANGNGTYEVVGNNICLALNYGIYITLRINIDEDSAGERLSILEEIPAEFRKQVSVMISNLFQENQKQSTFSLYMESIQKGYKYSSRYNNYGGCLSCRLNGIVVDTDGKIRFCTNSDDDNGVIGELKENGVVIYKNRKKYEEIMLLSARNNEKCRKCIELPFCIGGCPIARGKGRNICISDRADGLTLTERAKLDYYADIYAQNEVRKGVLYG